MNTVPSQPFWTIVQPGDALPVATKEQSLRDMARNYPESSATKKVMLQAAEEIKALRAALAPTTPVPAEPMAEVAEDYVFLLRKQANGERWPVGTKLYAVLPATTSKGTK